MTSDGSTPVEVIQAFLKDRDEPCPRCGYNLRNVSTATCPECGRAISLQINRSGMALAKAIARAGIACVLMAIVFEIYLIHAFGWTFRGMPLSVQAMFWADRGKRLVEVVLMVWAIRVAILAIRERTQPEKAGLVAARALYWAAGLEIAWKIVWLCVNL